MSTTEDVVFKASCDGSEQRYVLVAPEPRGTGAGADVLIALHGHGSDRWQCVREPRDECRAMRDVAAARAMLLVSPDYRAPASWMGPKAERDLVDIVEGLRGSREVRRVFVCGGSMGGAACLAFAVLHPELVRGVASMNGVADFTRYDNFSDAISASFGGTLAQAPDEYRRRSAGLRPERLTMPVGLTTGGLDASTPPESVLRLAESLRAANRNVLLIHREDEGHRTRYADARAILEFMVDRADAEELRA